MGVLILIWGVAQKIFFLAKNTIKVFISYIIQLIVVKKTTNTIEKQPLVAVNYGKIDLELKQRGGNQICKKHLEQDFKD